MEKSLHGVDLQFIFDEGNIQEEAVFADLRAAGLNVEQQHRPFEWPQYQLTGTVDAILKQNGDSFPVEIKSMSPFAWDKINTIEDMRGSKQIHLQKYPAQLTLYNLLGNMEMGVFVMKNKSNGFLKAIPMPLDLEYAEGLVKKAERINTHVKAGTLPDGVNAEEYCFPYGEPCAFHHICLPPIDREPQVILDEELEAMLREREGLKKSVSRYEELSDDIKAKCKGRAVTIVGDWKIKSTLVKKEPYTSKAVEYWDTRIGLLRKG
jgi:hypothetical protein